MVLVSVKKHPQKIPFARNDSCGRINQLIVQLKENFPEETKYKTVAFASTESEMNLVLKNNWQCLTHHSCNHCVEIVIVPIIPLLTIVRLPNAVSVVAVFSSGVCYKRSTYQEQ